MNTTRIGVISVLAAAVAASVPAQAQTSYHEARVIEATPIYRVVETAVPTRQCWEEEVVRSNSRHHYRSRTPGLLGAVIGGAIGNSVGHHNTSRKVGTVVGAILGGAIARDIQEADRYDHYDNVRLETVERCETVTAYEQGEKLVGYDVLYRYNGVDHTVRTPRDPGATIRVRVDVEPVI
jgi:uncharacterized protein YcfJ